MNGKELREKLEYAMEVIETAAAAEDASPGAVLEIALMVMEFGSITAKDMLKHLQAKK